MKLVWRFSARLLTIFTTAADHVVMTLPQQDGKVPKRVLVVDDEPGIVEVVEDDLRRAGSP